MAAESVSGWQPMKRMVIAAFVALPFMATTAFAADLPAQALPPEGGYYPGALMPPAPIPYPAVGPAPYDPAPPPQYYPPPYSQPGPAQYEPASPPAYYPPRYNQPAPGYYDPAPAQYIPAPQPHYYPQPASGDYSDCHRESRPVYDGWGNLISSHSVLVCG
jgi:hypothetical protein